MCWVIDNNMKLIDDLNSLSTNKKAVTIQTFDFERLYTNIDLTDLKDKICGIVDQCFEKTPKYLFINIKTKYAWWTNSNINKNENVVILNHDIIVSHIKFLIDNIYFRFCDKYYKQNKGIPMGTDCAPLLANLYLHYYEYTYLNELMTEEGYNINDSKRFNNIYRYIDDLVVINNTEFSNEINNIYPNTLRLTQQGDKDDNESAAYLDLDINIVDNKFDIKV
jgi:hypothetical protein